jgi:CHAT domain-containing protein
LQGIIYTHNSAKEELIKSDEIKNYKYIHIASHGFINEEKPNLSGILFTKEEKGEDGILYANEIYNLNLDADLVVLSACESGLGKIIKGEGLISLTRGLLFAGAKNVVVSLWRVADKSTSELMIEFYRNILNGESYSASLRQAKLKLIKNGKYSYPLEWSPFILIGR